MLNQVTRALAALIRPISSRAVQTDKSAADRDAMGQAYENLHQQKQGKKEDPESDAQRQGPEAPSPETAASAGPSEKPAAQVISIQGQTPEEIAEARNKAIGVSQAWVGLMTSLEEQKANSGESMNRGAGPSAYEKANTGTSKVARAKKGVILDKKAA
jgi:hypothetical protein